MESEQGAYQVGHVSAGEVSSVDDVILEATFRYLTEDLGRPAPASRQRALSEVNPDGAKL
jgi:hypothetical protein